MLEYIPSIDYYRRGLLRGELFICSKQVFVTVARHYESCSMGLTSFPRRALMLVFEFVDAQLVYSEHSIPIIVPIILKV